MNGVAQYILTVTAAAMLVGILQSLAGQGAMGGVAKLVSGIFLTLTVLSPIWELELPDLQGWIAGFSIDGQSVAAEGSAMAEGARVDIITTQVEAYILDKAALYQASLAVDVKLNAAGVPQSVYLTGEVSPYARTQLSRILETDLGLGEEAQQWSS